MQNAKTTLKSIFERTGIAGILYSSSGEVLYLPPGEHEPTSEFPPPEAFVGSDTICYDGRTYLRTSDGTGAYCYVSLPGDDIAARNYAILLEMAFADENSHGGGESTTEEKLALLLSGDLNSVRRNMLRSQLAEVEFRHFALLLTAGAKDMLPGIRHFLSAVTDKRDYLVRLDDRTLLLLRYAGDENSEYRSAGEFASVLYENIKEELRVDLSIATGGTVHAFGELPASYEKLLCAHKFGRLLDTELCVYDYKDYALVSLLSELPKTVLAKALDSLLELNCADVAADRELMHTADEFMRNSLNISETSRKMYVHRNTLIYRLDKIEKDTGLNLRSFGDSLVFRLIKILTILLKTE